MERFKTRNGSEIEYVGYYPRLEQPVVGIHNNTLETWAANGKYLTFPDTPSSLDLVDFPIFRRGEFYRGSTFATQRCGWYFFEDNVAIWMNFQRGIMTTVAVFNPLTGESCKHGSTYRVDRSQLSSQFKNEIRSLINDQGYWTATDESEYFGYL